MRTTINDIAEKAGVSNMAVSLAFRGSLKISEATRKRILSIARELNYVPNQAARQLRSGQTDIVGFLVTDLANPFHSLMIKHAQRAFSEMGLTLFTAGSDWNEEHERASVERLIRMRARGVLLCSCEKSPEPFELLDRAGIPYVALDSVPDTYGGPCVINDLAQCGALMADHFRAVGARKPAYVDAAADMLFFSAFRKTREAFRDTLHRAGIELSAENCIPAGMTLEAGAEAFRRLAADGFKTDGVFCVNDLCALGFQNEAAKHGLHAGRDFALAGIDNMEISALSALALTSIRQPYQEIARRAVRMLCALMEKKALPSRRIVLEQELCARASTLEMQSAGRAVRRRIKT